MGLLLETHYVVAFLVVLCAIVFSWSSLGRRVVNAVAVLQLIVGIALAGVMGSSRMPLPQTIWVHILSAVVVLGCYGMAMRYGRQAGGARAALAFSAFGLIFTCVTFYLGLHMTGKV